MDSVVVEVVTTLSPRPHWGHME